MRSGTFVLGLALALALAVPAPARLVDRKSVV